MRFDRNTAAPSGDGRRGISVLFSRDELSAELGRTPPSDGIRQKLDDAMGREVGHRNVFAMAGLACDQSHARGSCFPVKRNRVLAFRLPATALNKAIGKIRAARGKSTQGLPYGIGSFHR
jgi:hypothetical protein